MNSNRLIRILSRKFISFFGLAPLKTLETQSTQYYETHRNILIDQHLREHLFQNPKYRDTKRLNKFEYNTFSQNGEDGIIEEIFNRLGETNRCFVEFGAHSARNNSSLLLLKGWEGLFLEGSKTGFQNINSLFGSYIKSGRLKTVNAFITAENIAELLSSAKVPTDLDYLCIDIDGNDYWIWAALDQIKPRVVQIEYNASLGPKNSLVMTYSPSRSWDGTNYFGASLKALEKLGKKKGYVLVGCDFSGCNAFFVRSDQDLSGFEQPFESEHHFEPPRYYLQRENGHPVGFGEYIVV